MGRLGEKFASKLLTTASSNIESTLKEIELEGRQPDDVAEAAAKSLLLITQRGASVLAQESLTDR